MRIRYYLVPLFVAGGLLMAGCGGKRAFVRKMEEKNLTAGLSQPGKSLDTTTVDIPKEIKFKENGKDAYISVATKDKDGSDIASYTLSEVRVFAKNKTVSERNGKVNVDFIVSVPKGLVDKNWQVHLVPKVTKDVTKDSLFLDEIFIILYSERKEASSAWIAVHWNISISHSTRKAIVWFL